METIRLRIYDLRKAGQMSQKELSDAVGVSVHEPAIIRLNQDKPTKSSVSTDSVLFILAHWWRFRTALDKIINLHQRSQKCPSMMRSSCGF